MLDPCNPNNSTIREALKQLRFPIIVGVAGDSGSGKTTFSNGIRRLIGSDLVSTICTDGYHKENREQRQQSGRLPLDPEANHLDVLAQHLERLTQGKSIEVPIYNHGTGQFDPPETLSPTPIIVVEGLHVLYPQFLPFLDFSLYVDPDRQVKWDWKWERDVKKRGHKAEALEQEMLQREAAFVRWIDAQKIDANVVVQVGHSQLEDLLPTRFADTQAAKGYRVSLILEPTLMPLPSLSIPLDLAAMLELNKPAFLLAAVPFRYWGRTAIAVHIDGNLAPQTISELEQYIVGCTGIPLQEAVPQENYEKVSATSFAQLLIAWRFLAQVQQNLGVEDALH
ncbi:phosphoribulokinase [Phormidium sp. FACHB-1136]|uniref:phosphoribulokinase n=1 Tax=Phormidium sp. FACHB-1136 TaxID=2692848 RepID=UPI0016874E4A|nr:phosphoribulokinase [Phormidium sp. FACHB-1136]MBD2426941.1 phosphoribulokinase [Phormidium sp. FACHB-1136]